MPLDTLRAERLLWNAFKKARKEDPLASKIDYRYYERLNAAYKAQRDQAPTLDRYLKPVSPPSDG